MKQEKELLIVNSDLQATDAIITQLDDAIQRCGNLELSRQLNEISDCFEAIKQLMKNTPQEIGAAVNE